MKGESHMRLHPKLAEGAADRPLPGTLHVDGHCVEIRPWILVGKTSKQVDSSSLDLWEQSWGHGRKASEWKWPQQHNVDDERGPKPRDQHWRQKRLWMRQTSLRAQREASLGGTGVCARPDPVT